MAILPSLTRSPAAFVTDTALKAGSTASVNQSLTWRGGGAVLPTAGTAWSRKACACAAGASIEANMPTRATRKSIRLCICHLLGSEGEFGEEAVRRRGEAAGRRRAAVGLEDLHLRRSGRLGAACRHDHQIAALSAVISWDQKRSLERRRSAVAAKPPVDGERPLVKRTCTCTGAAGWAPPAGTITR